MSDCFFGRVRPGSRLMWAVVLELYCMADIWVYASGPFFGGPPPPFVWLLLPPVDTPHVRTGRIEDLGASKTRLQGPATESSRLLYLLPPKQVAQELRQGSPESRTHVTSRSPFCTREYRALRSWQVPCCLQAASGGHSGRRRASPASAKGLAATVHGGSCPALGPLLGQLHAATLRPACVEALESTML